MEKVLLLYGHCRKKQKRWNFAFWNFQAIQIPLKDNFFYSSLKGLSHIDIKAGAGSFEWQADCVWNPLEESRTAESICDDRYWSTEGTWATAWGYELAEILRRRDMSWDDQKTKLKLQAEEKEYKLESESDPGLRLKLVSSLGLSERKLWSDRGIAERANR